MTDSIVDREMNNYKMIGALAIKKKTKDRLLKMKVKLRSCLFIQKL